jgi:hypothetical protein
MFFLPLAPSPRLDEGGNFSGDFECLKIVNRKNGPFLNSEGTPEIAKTPENSGFCKNSKKRPFLAIYGKPQKVVKKCHFKVILS